MTAFITEDDYIHNRKHQLQPL